MNTNESDGEPSSCLRNPVVQRVPCVDSLRVRHLLKAAIDGTDWKRDALAAHLSEVTGLKIDGPYLSKMLAGERPINEVHLDAMPLDIKARYARLNAEAHGFVVVEPIATTQDAARSFVAGLLGLLTPHLPAKASGMAKAEMSAPVARRKVG